MRETWYESQQYEAEAESDRQADADLWAITHPGPDSPVNRWLAEQAEQADRVANVNALFETMGRMDYEAWLAQQANLPTVETLAETQSCPWCGLSPESH